jgi:hypothetical protein
MAILETIWGWLTSVWVKTVGELAMLYYKFREQRAKTLKAERELKLMEDERRLKEKIDKGYEEIIDYYRFTEKEGGGWARVPTDKDKIGSILFGQKFLSEEEKRVVDGVWKKIHDEGDAEKAIVGSLITRRMPK